MVSCEFKTVVSVNRYHQCLTFSEDHRIFRIFYKNDRSDIPASVVHMGYGVSLAPPDLPMTNKQACLSDIYNSALLAKQVGLRVF